MTDRLTHVPFAGQTFVRLEQLLGCALTATPRALRASAPHAGLTFTIVRQDGDVFYADLELSAPRLDVAGQRLHLAVDCGRGQAFLLRWGGDQGCYLLRLEDPGPGSLCDRIACNWLVRRIREGFAFQHPALLAQAA